MGNGAIPFYEQFNLEIEKCAGQQMELLNLPDRVKEILSINGINNLYQLVSMSRDELRYKYNLEAKTIAIIEHRILLLKNTVENQRLIKLSKDDDKTINDVVDCCEMRNLDDRDYSLDNNSEGSKDGHGYSGANLHIDSLELFNRTVNVLNRSKTLSLQDLLKSSNEEIGQVHYLCTKPKHEIHVSQTKSEVQDKDASNALKTDGEPKVINEASTENIGRVNNSDLFKDKKVELNSDIDIERMNVSIRTKHALLKAGFKTINEIAQIDIEQLNKIKNLGYKSITELKEYFKQNAEVKMSDETHDEFQKIGAVQTELGLQDKDTGNVIKTDGELKVINEAFPETIGREINIVLFKDKQGEWSSDLDIERLDFSIRTTRALLKAGFKTIDEIALLDLEQLNNIRNLGYKSVTEIIDYFRQNAEVILLNENLDGFVESLLQSIEESSKDDSVEMKRVLKNIKTVVIKNIDELKKKCSDTDVSKIIENEEFRRIVFENPSVISSYADLVLSKIRSNEQDEEITGTYDFGSTIIYDNAIKMLLDEKKIEIVNNKFRIRLPYISDWIDSIDDSKHANAVRLRVEGKTLEEIGQLIGVTRERVRQIVNKELRTKPVLREDDFAYWYKKYYFDRESFVSIFEENVQVYEYLNLAYENGYADLESMLEDQKATSELKGKIFSYIHRDSILIGDEYVLCKRELICRKLAELLCSDKDVTFDDFFKQYMHFLEEKNLNDNEKLLFPNQRAFAARIEDSRYALIKYGRRFRYYPIEEIDIDEFISELHLEQYKDIEISTLKLINEDKEIMSEYDIRDEYELHNLLKKTEEIWNKNHIYDISITRMPFISFGMADREKQTKELLFKIAPVSVETFCDTYEKVYGVGAKTVFANFVPYISNYYHNGICSIDQPLFSPDEKEYMSNYLLEDFYFIDDIKAAFVEKFKDSDIDKVNARTIKELGFRTYTDYVVRDSYSSGYEYFKYFLTRGNSIDLRKLDRRLTYIQNLSSTLDELRESYELLEYEDMKFMKLSHVQSVYPYINKEYISEFVSAVLNCAKDERYFTIKRLQNKGFHNKILETELGNWFPSGLVKNSRRVRFLKTRGTVIFYQGDRQITTADFIRHILKLEKKMDIYDFINYSKNEYGVLLEKDKIIQLIKPTNMYYDAIMEKIYLSKDYYYDEI